MKSKYLTNDEIIVRGDAAVMRAKAELAKDIAMDRKY